MNTPRTDAATRMAFSGEYMVPIEDAQKLERELAEVTKQRDDYKAACDQYSEDEMLCKLQEVTKQRDALAEALEELERTAGQSTLWDDPARHNARKALAAVKGGSHE